MPDIKFSGDKIVEGDHREINPDTGQQKAYIVLSDEERAKGYVRPVRQEYIHTGTNPKMEGSVLLQPDKDGCGTLTKMARDIAETYARDPSFYGGTFCVGCRSHFPLAQFRWAGTVEVVGS